MPNVPDPSFPICPLCHQPVALENSKADENGRAVHEECYVANLKSNDPEARRS
jgi:hypothetical protein